MKIFSLFQKKQKPRDLFIAALEGIALVAIWRGSWGLMDVYIYPENYLHSSIISLIVGILILKLVKAW